MIKVFYSLKEKVGIFPPYCGEYVYANGKPFDKQCIFINGSFWQKADGRVYFDNDYSK